MRVLPRVGQVRVGQIARPAMQEVAGQKDSMAALAAQALTRPIDPGSQPPARRGGRRGNGIGCPVGVDHCAGRAAQRDGVGQGVDGELAVIRLLLV